MSYLTGVRFTEGVDFHLPNGDLVRAKIILQPYSGQESFTPCEKVEVWTEVRLLPVEPKPKDYIYHVAKDGEVYKRTISFGPPERVLYGTLETTAIDVHDLRIALEGESPDDTGFPDTPDG